MPSTFPEDEPPTVSNAEPSPWYAIALELRKQLSAARAKSDVDRQTLLLAEGTNTALRSRIRALEECNAALTARIQRLEIQ